MQLNLSDQDDTTSPPKKKNKYMIILSILAATFGVQSSQNLKHDFKHHNATPFIIGGIIFTVIFITTLLIIIHWVVSQPK